MPPRPKQQTAGFSPKDAIYIVYRHKFKIILLTLLSLGVAGYFYTKQKPVYLSSTQLLVRYVVDRGGSVDSFDEQGGVGGRYADYVLNTEIKILTSIDLAYDVAESLGVDVVLPHVKGERTISAAASIIRGGTTVEQSKGSNIMVVSFSHPDQKAAKTILAAVVQRYFERHMKIRRSTGNKEFINVQVVKATEKLADTEARLNTLKANMGILELETTMASLEEQRTKIDQDTYAAQANLAAQVARVKEFKELQKEEEGNTSEKKEIETGQSPRPEVKTRKEVSPEVIAEYQALVQRLRVLSNRKLELLTKFKASTNIVKLTQGQIDQVKRDQQGVLKRHPELLQSRSKVTQLSTFATELSPDFAAPLNDIGVEKAAEAAFAARLKILQEQQGLIGKKISSIAKVRNDLEQLEREKKANTEKYEFLKKSLERSLLDDTLDPSEIPNIAVVQKATTAVPVMDNQMKKILLGVAASGLVFGLGIAFLIELVLDRRVKRAGEIENNLQIPVMLTIPKLEDKSERKLLPGPGGQEIKEHFINPYTTAIRDRLFYQFELNNVKHRPKLIAVTSLSEGAGASTIAAGLASSLQGAGEARVLFVDMTNDRMYDLNTSKAPAGSRSQRKVEAPVDDFANTRRVTLKAALHAPHIPTPNENETLYVSSGSMAGNDSVEKKLAPRKLFEMMPSFRESEFDYIVFDMPPMGPISPTVAMAGIMDQVMLVLDADNTNRDDLKTAYDELSKGKPQISSIFNKAKPTLLG